MVQSNKHPWRLNQAGSMPKGILLTLFLVFVFAIVGSFKSANTHAYAVSPSSILSGISGSCLDVKDDSSKLGAVVDNYPCNGTDAQAWSVDTIAIKHNGLCLSVTNDSQRLGAQVNLNTCNNYPGQVWLTSHGNLYNPNAQLCLVDPDSSRDQSLVLGNCSVQANQQWSSPMLSLNCSSIQGKTARVACYAESDFETWQSGNISHKSLLNIYTDGAAYEEWCADFVSYVYKQAGYPFSNGETDGWDENNANNIQSQGFKQDGSGYLPQPGDVGFFNYTGGHVEIVISGGKHPTFIYGNSAIIDSTTGNGQMEANSIMKDGSLGGLIYYLSPLAGS